MKLIPPDLKLCQADIPKRKSFMQFGGQDGFQRCNNVPIVVIFEIKDKKKGQMSLCKMCLQKYVEQCT